MLYEEFTHTRAQRDIKDIKDRYLSLNLPYLDNLNKKFIIRPYQADCFARLEYKYEDWEYDKKVGNKTTKHLFFNLATGAGKTLIMAENILFLYEQGYRNFIFLVHQNPILDKTRDNFLNKNSNKYLFNQDIIFNSKKINIREVETFTNVTTDDINIIFTTCAGLHNNITTPKENRMSLASLKDIKIVLLADEAHHLLKDTKNGQQKLDENENSWEEIVKQKLLPLNPDNILLEYSATIDLNDVNIREKYEDKIIMKYGLKEFREDGYSKDIYLFKSDLDKNARILSALIMSLYRQSVTEHYSAKDSKLQLNFENGFKPVVLVKSAKVADSNKDLEEFKKYLPTINGEDIEKILNIDDKRIKKAKKWFTEIKKYSYNNIADAIKQEFNPDVTIRQINGEKANDTKNSQILSELNNLDSNENNVRIIFAVKMLNEGWDVLCLYDIVRLDEENKAETKTITSDIQLIGRGCRYNPFVIDTDIDKKYIRKFDNDAEDNDLRTLEEFYYHSKNNSKYITSLKEGLVKEGLKDKEERQTITVELKKDIPETRCRWDNKLVYTNELIAVDKSEKNTIFDYKVEKEFPYELSSSTSLSSFNAYDENDTTSTNYITKNIKMDDRGVLRKAMDINSFYEFRNLKKYLPNMKTKDELFESIEHNITIKLNFPENYGEISKHSLLEIYSYVLKRIEKCIKSNDYKKQGSNVFKPTALKKVLDNYTLTIKPASDPDSNGHSIAKASSDIKVDVEHEPWYAFKDFYGDTLEKSLIRHISDALKNKIYPFDNCQNLLLIRNHNICKLYDFDSDRGFEPDFLLYFTREKENMNYMLFVEPKGENLKEIDKWKQDFMLQIEDKAIIEGNDSGLRNYKVIGLKFYTENDNHFPDSMQEMFEKHNVK